MTRRRKTALLVAAALAWTAAHQWFILRRAFNGGVLSGLLPWDDCMIVERPLWPLTAMTVDPTWRGLLAAALSYAPRGPVAEIQSFVALVVSGGNIVSPYLLNGWAEALALLSIIFAARRLRLTTTVAILALLAVAPFTSQALLMLKADYKAGLWIAAAIFVLYTAVAEGGHRLYMFGTALLSLALVAKLTAFFLPIWALCSLAIFEVLRHQPKTGQADLSVSQYVVSACRNAWIERRTFIAPAALLVVPFLLFFAWGLTDDLYWYIRVALDASWQDGLTIPQRTAFYLQRQGTAVPLSATIFGVCVLWWAIRERRPDQLVAVVALAAIALGILIPFSVASTSGPEYAAYFGGTLLGASLVAIRTVAERSNRASALSLAIVLALAVVFFPPPRNPRDAVALQESQATLRKVVDDMRLRQPAPKRVRMMFEDSVAGFPNLSLLHFELTHRPLNAGRIDDLGSRLQMSLDDVDVVLTLVPTGDVALAGYQLNIGTVSPATRELARGDRLIASDGRFERSGTYPWRGAELRMYARRAPS